jgi:tRNA modification GTPase
MADSDTIAAIATPIGVGAVSIIRISGPGAISIVDRSFRGAHALTTAGGYTVHHGKLVDRTRERT